MKVLLDEMMPPNFCERLPDHDCRHIEEVKGKGLRNGELLTYARSTYEALITLDKGIRHQQNHAGHKLIIVIVRVKDSSLETVIARAADVALALGEASAGSIIEL